jgi:4-amino-4-deoxy-L-arabinose transferase-like glycosyltransferase
MQPLFRIFAGDIPSLFTICLKSLNQPKKICRKVIFSFKYVFIFLYALLTAGCLNNCYFWDTVQQISKEAHWFYQTNFRYLIIPSQNSLTDMVVTGYHPPLMGMLTAALWKIFGVHLWVSHLLALICFFVFAVQHRNRSKSFFPAHQAGCNEGIFLEASLMAHFLHCFTDIIMLTAFIASLRDC